MSAAASHSWRCTHGRSGARIIQVTERGPELPPEEVAGGLLVQTIRLACTGAAKTGVIADAARKIALATIITRLAR
ncbi:MAG TPA: hypothetical protein VE968_08610 [Sphingomicrobium sp.]|nr:hypothetical protein [Sphingomicrobium sp.]